MPGAVTAQFALARTQVQANRRAQLRAKAVSILPTRQHAPSIRRSVRVGALRVEAEAESSNPIEQVKDQYTYLTNSVPPLATAVSVPIIALSLLCKAITGSGFPGFVPGLVEGISFLVLPIGLGSFIPRAQEILAEGNYDAQIVLDTLSRPNPQIIGLKGNATQRVDSFDADPNTALGMQLIDLRKQRDMKANESADQKAARAKMNDELAAVAIAVGKSLTEEDVAKFQENQSQGIDLTKQKVTETIAESITAANYDEDITKYDEQDLGDKLDLSSNAVASGTPTATGKKE